MGGKGGGLRAAYGIARRTILDSKNRAKSAGFMVLLFSALAFANVAAVAQSFAQRDYMTALASRDSVAFFSKLRRAVFLLVLMMPARSLAEFAAGGLSQIWRDTLTLSLLNDYFHPKVVYWLRRGGNVVDPDMRIAVEAGHFTEMLVLLVRDTFENSLKLMGFLGVVYSISHVLFIVMAAYAFLGAFATVTLFGGPLVQLDRNIRSQEATFRKSISRCLERAEPLCLCAGEASEGMEARGRYERLRRQQWARVWGRTSLGTFRECFGWAAYLLPVAIVAPLWLQDKVPFGTVAQAVMAFHISLDALTVVVRKFRSVSALMAEGSRLEGLVQALSTSMAAAQRPQPLPEEVPGPEVQAAGVALHLPNGSQLYEDLSFQIKDGQRLIILGPSGAGKTTLIRALAGLWSDGDGDLRVSSSTVFLPQDPYIPEGSLRRVLTFPEVHFSDQQILACAERARLQEVLQRFGQSLEAEADWETVLSRGEKQRCAFCRLLLLRPRVAVLDEATSALDEATEGALYQELDAQQGPVSVVSISHRPALSRFHTHILRYQKKLNSPGGSVENPSAGPSQGGVWTFEALGDGQRPHPVAKKLGRRQLWMCSCCSFEIYRRRLQCGQLKHRFADHRH